ncbi:MAG TPA: DUF3300 domain-containing protein [Bryobacteraceae bacterium]|jgi:hypothetical protein|nr:DUF3300 domain-containing protein [Bryobacteraceae bacterium]
MQKKIKIVSVFAVGVWAAALIPAQAPPPPMGPGELDNLVQRIALYPDAMLANILTAATYPDQIPEADQWADQHAALHGDALAHAISEDHLPWDPSVQALLPFPQVLELMARDMAWTQKLGDAVLAQRGDVMDAVQRMRHAAQRYGYLQTNAYYSVADEGGFVVINPLNPGVFVVPVYDPAIVFVAPRPGFAVRAAISFGPRITLGVAFAPWGWGPGVFARFNWGGHGWYVNNHEWGRTWANRAAYHHEWSVPHYERAGRVESHKVPPARRPEERHRGR